MTGARTPLAAQQAAREAISKAMVATVEERVRGKAKAARPIRRRALNRHELAVLMAVVAEVLLYGRLSDSVASRQLLARLGVDTSDDTTKEYRNAERALRRALRILDQAGAWHREPGRGDRSSTFTFPDPGRGTEPRDERGTEPRAGEGSDTPGGEGYTHTPERGTGPPQRGVPNPASVVSSVEDLPVCVYDLALSKVLIQGRRDTHQQEQELRTGLDALVAEHGEGVIREHVASIDLGLAHSGLLLRAIKDLLPKQPKTNGHRPSPSYPGSTEPAFDLDENNNLIRIHPEREVVER